MEIPVTADSGPATVSTRGEGAALLIRAIGKSSPPSKKTIDIVSTRTCACRPNHLNCLTAKEWLKSQLGVWQFTYEGRDARDKSVHPAAFPISLARRTIDLFTHEGELVLDPFVGSDTTLVAAQDASRNAVGFDLQRDYIKLCEERLRQQTFLGDSIQPTVSTQTAIQDDARHISEYLTPDTVSLIMTSPPYVNLLNRKRTNKSRRHRKNDQYQKVEQYSQDRRDLGIMPLDEYRQAMGDIYEQLLSLLRPGAHCVINVPDMWWENERVTIHIAVVQA